MELLGRRREDGNLPLFHRKAAADEPPEIHGQGKDPPVDSAASTRDLDQQ